MTLAQVVYQMSTDSDFASKLFSSPESTLATRGIKLSKEELAFILTAHCRGEQEKMRIVSLAEMQKSGWGR
jgi:hypothetical protein